MLVSNQVSWKSQPSQNVPSKILKQLSFFFGQMSENINESFFSAVFPTAFKQGIVFPKFRSGDIEEISNYRPITILHFASKFNEKLIALHFKRFLDKNAFFYELQSSDGKHHSAETALLDLTSNLLCSTNNRRIFLVIPLYLSAAFDTVDHETFLSFCFKFVIIVQAHLSIKPYVNGPTRCVLTDGSYSADNSYETGVPQGSILGLLLFILCLLPFRTLLNDFLACYHIYADDIMIYLEFELGTTFANFPKHKKHSCQCFETISCLEFNSEQLKNSMYICYESKNSSSRDNHYRWDQK